MILLRAVIVIRLLAIAALACLLQACGGVTTEFDRVAPPVRFGDLRETAAWVEGFDPQWWDAIDVAYAEYDRSFDDEFLRRWSAFSVEASRGRLRSESPDERDARRQFALHREFNEALSRREAAFFSALEQVLPLNAAPFITLARERAAFHRATGMLREPGQRLPGPLEVLALAGRRSLDAEAVERAALAYQRLAAVASDQVRARGALFVDFCAENQVLEAARDTAAAAERASQGGDDESKALARSAREAAERAVEGRVKRFRADAERKLETLRLALLAEGRAFGGAIADTEARSLYLEQLDGSLHSGMRTESGMRAFTRIARIMIAREHPDDAAMLAELDRLLEQEVDVQRQLRVALASASPQARKRAYEGLRKVGDPIGQFVDGKLRARGGIWPVLTQVVPVVASERSAEGAADLLLADKTEPPPDPEVYTAQSRDKDLQFILGCPLEPSVLRALGDRLRIPPTDEARIRAMWEEESKSIAEVAGDAQRRITETFSAIGSGDEFGTRATPEVIRARVAAVMSAIASGTARVRSADRSANQRIVAEIAQTAAVSIDDDRVRVTRVELELLSELGTTRSKRELEPICGVGGAALFNPFEVARLASDDEGERLAAELIVLTHAEELLAAQRETAEVIRRNLRSFLTEVLEQWRFVGTPRRWNPEPAGPRAIAIRLSIVDELRSALGDRFADRYEERMRNFIARGCEPERPAAMTVLLRDPRAGAIELHAQAGQRRNTALNRFVRWRSAWTAPTGLDGRDSWKELERIAPEGWLLLSRAADADARAIAAFEAMLDANAAPPEEIRALRVFPTVSPLQLVPAFD